MPTADASDGGDRVVAPGGEPVPSGTAGVPFAADRAPSWEADKGFTKEGSALPTRHRAQACQQRGGQPEPRPASRSTSRVARPWGKDAAQAQKGVS